MDAIASHIPLEGACNARDLGGYAAADGAVTARYAFFRCETPVHLTGADVALLLGLGLRGVIDLRSESEIGREPGPFLALDGVLYRNIPLFTAPLPPHLAQKATMADLYVHMLDSAQEGFRDIFRFILDTPGGVLFHCSAGKDRTGLVAALLLLCAGVGRETVVAEYAYTGRLLGRWVDEQMTLAKSYGRELDPRMLAADPLYLETALTHLDTAYGGPVPYLRAIGLTHEETARLARRVILGAEA